MIFGCDLSDLYLFPVKAYQAASLSASGLCAAASALNRM